MFKVKYHQLCVSSSERDNFSLAVLQTNSFDKICIKYFPLFDICREN